MEDEENKNEAEEDDARPRPFPPDMMQTPEERNVGHIVRSYIWGKGPVEHQNVSAHLNRKLVSRFVGFEITDLPPVRFWRVRILADLYNLIEYLGTFQSFLQRQENKPEELDRSIACDIILEEIGDEAQKNFAAQYYDYLVTHQFSNKKFAELIKCLTALGPRAQPDPLRRRMEQETMNLAAREATDLEAGVERRAIEELADNEFFLIEETNKTRQRVLAIANVDARLDELIRIYLELTDDGGTEYLQLWTQQKIRRNAEAEGNEKVIAAFRQMTKSLRDLEEADKTFCLIRCYNAIEFFLGKLEAEEEAFMRKNRQRQVDPLRYAPPPTHLENDEEDEEDDMDFEEEEETESE